MRELLAVFLILGIANVAASADKAVPEAKGKPTKEQKLTPGKAEQPAQRSLAGAREQNPQAARGENSQAARTEKNPQAARGENGQAPRGENAQAARGEKNPQAARAGKDLNANKMPAK